jgi:hypothetical protein
MCNKTMHFILYDISYFSSFSSSVVLCLALRYILGVIPWNTACVCVYVCVCACMYVCTYDVPWRTGSASPLTRPAMPEFFGGCAF